MARRTKSLKYEVLQNGGGYGHRDHRNKKNRVQGYKVRRTWRIIQAEKQAKRERKFAKKQWTNL